MVCRLNSWYVEFKPGRTSSEDEAVPGRPLNSPKIEMFFQVRDLIYSDSTEEIALALDNFTW